MQNHNRAALFTFLIILLGLLILFLKMISPFLIAVSMGAVIALVSEPAFKKLQVKGLSRRGAAFIVTLLVSLLIVVPLVAFSMRAIHQGLSIGESLSKNEDVSFQSIAEKLSGIPMVDTLVGDQNAVEAKIREYLKESGYLITTGGFRFFSHLPDHLLHLILALFSCFIFLMNGKALSHWTFSKIPVDRDVEEKIKSSAAKTSRSVILSVLAAAVSETLIIFTGFLTLGVPGAIFAAGATFIFSFVPILSCTPVWISGALYLYLHAFTGKAFVMIGFGILAGITENLMKPLILKGSGNMHPLLGLVAIFGGLQMFGLFGVLVGPIIAALLVALLEIWPSVGERSGIHFGES